MSENYLQHSDHFARILNSQEAAKIVNLETNNSIENKIHQKSDEVIVENENKENNLDKRLIKLINSRNTWCASSTHHNEEKFCGYTHLNLKKKEIV